MPPSIGTLTSAKSLLGKVNRILDILEALLIAPPPITNWPEWLERTTALLAQYENAMRDLKPILLNCLLIPVEGGHDHIPNVMLRTKPAPEVEEHVGQLASSAHDPNSIIKPLLHIIQETTEMLRSAPKSVTTPVPVPEDERLIHAVRQYYTLQT